MISDNFATSYVTANNIATLHSMVEAKGLSIHKDDMPREMIDDARSILYFAQHCRRPRGLSSQRDGWHGGGWSGVVDVGGEVGG